MPTTPRCWPKRKRGRAGNMALLMRLKRTGEHAALQRHGGRNQAALSPALMTLILAVPAGENDLLAGVEMDALHALHMQVAIKGAVPAGKGKEGHGGRN